MNNNTKIEQNYEDRKEKEYNKLHSRILNLTLDFQNFGVHVYYKKDFDYHIHIVEKNLLNCLKAMDENCFSNSSKWAEDYIFQDDALRIFDVNIQDKIMTSGLIDKLRDLQHDLLYFFNDFSEIQHEQEYVKDEEL